MSKLSGKIAVVTGASKGIGAGIAKALGAAGASVVVNYASDKEGAERVVAEIVHKEGRAVAVQADVAKGADVKRLFAETVKAFGAPNVLVNNAGIFKFEPIEEVTATEFHRQFDTNVLGSLLTIQEAVKHFGPEGGSIINVSSVVAQGAHPGSSIYAATKAALDSVTRVLALELGPRKIRVNSVNPGPTVTEGVKTLGLLGGEQEKLFIANTPLGRLGQPEDIGPAVVFLASDGARWITGEAIRISGGLK